MLFSMIKLFSY